ncbi:MAG: AAA family ATPase [Planctomycetes bacterium]|nr:AAA family ATPase [Planctomycetota bacterium]
MPITQIPGPQSKPIKPTRPAPTQPPKWWIQSVVADLLRRLRWPQHKADPAQESPPSTTGKPRPTEPPAIPHRPVEVATRPLKKIAVVNHKGGVGKTSTTVHLAGALAEMDYRVLVFDCDSQGDLTCVTISAQQRLASCTR